MDSLSTLGYKVIWEASGHECTVYRDGFILVKASIGVHTDWDWSEDDEDEVPTVSVLAEALVYPPAWLVTANVGKKNLADTSFAELLAHRIVLSEEEVCVRNADRSFDG